MSVRVTSNGRSSLLELKQQFDKVFIKYDRKEDGTITTTALLISGTTVHVGISKFSNRKEQFSKSKGRNMALGRAELARNIFVKEENPRNFCRQEALAFTVSTTSKELLQSLLASIVGTYQIN